MQTYSDYVQDNIAILKSFERVREIILVLMELDPSNPNHLTVTGSRGKDHVAAYHGSDVDCAFVVDGTEEEMEAETQRLIELLKKVVLVLEENLEIQGQLEWKSIKTLAGLALFPITGIVVGDLPRKLDITIRPRAKHELIETNMREKWAELFDTDEKKVEYIRSNEAAINEGRMDDYMKYKAWCKPLAPIHK
jgi:hypothetical protein